MESLRTRYESEGVVLTIKTSKTNRFVLKCDRGGEYANVLNLTNESRQRQTHTRLTGCEFQIVCSCVKGLWAVRKISGNHNHDIGGNLAGHSVKRRLSEDEKKRVRSLHNSGLSPKDILSVLRTEFGNHYSTAKEIYNEVADAREEELRGRKPIEALLDLIRGRDYLSDVLMNGDIIKSIFFMHRSSIELCKMFKTVFLMDCTYKTNNLKMPLLNIVGITSTYATFNAGFAFLNEETEEAYSWVLRNFSKVVDPKVLCTDRELALMNSISTVFPTCQNLLCRWHINKNIVANCKTGFSNEDWGNFMDEWNFLVSSPSVEAFGEALSLFKDKFATSHFSSWNYIKTTWLPHKERFVECFINELPHFGSMSTSRVEGNHHIIKSYLRVGNLKLFPVTKRLSFMLSNQMVELNAEIERQKLRRAHHYDHECLKDLIYRVSEFAMQKLIEQLERAKEVERDGDLCHGRFKKSWGLPCHHYIRSCIKNEVAIDLREIHEQWMLENNPLSTIHEEATPRARDMPSPRTAILKKVTRVLQSENPRASSLIARFNHVLDTPDVEIQEPSIVVKKRGRPANSKNVSSKTRDKSHFEYVEGRKCSSCGQSGHNSRTCPTKRNNN